MRRRKTGIKVPKKFAYAFFRRKYKTKKGFFGNYK